jgi:hypothetical protein
MNAYSRDDERAIRTGRLVEDWTKSGLLTPGQRELVMPQLAVGLRRTNKFLRITLFVFGAMILQSALGLLAVIVGGFANSVVAAVLCLLAGAACVWLSSHLVSRYNLYRFGVEEAVALSSAGLAAGGAALLFAGDGNGAAVIGLAVAAVMLAVLYLRFGYVYAAVFAMAAVVALPFQFGSSESVQRAVAVILLAAIVVTVRVARAEHGEEHPGDALTVIEAVAWLGMYLLVNLVVTSGITQMDRASVVHWVTYGAIWLLPAVLLWLAIRGGERPLLWAGIAMALGTLLSNKEYLGSPRYEWDPIVFGLFLMGVAIAIRRWLASGDGGMRHGYTSARLVASDKDHLGALAMVSTVHTDVPVSEQAPAADPSIGGGGRSGGGGAGGSF